MITGQIKITGDAYCGGFSNGLTLTESATMARFGKAQVEVSEDASSKKEVSVRHADNGLMLTIVSTCDKVKDVTTIETSVENGGSENVTLELLTSFMLTNVKVDKIHRLKSFWSAEGKLRTETINDLHLEKSWAGHGVRCEKFGSLGSMPVRSYFPFLAVEDSESGTITALQLYCGSSWQMEITCRHDDTFTISGGIADRDYGAWTKVLHPGEKLSAPKAVMAVGKDLYDVCDRLVKAQNPAISPEDENMDILFNEYCTTWGNPSFENVKKCADRIAGKGIKFLVIDCGWYGSDAEWFDCMGDWDLDAKRFPGGLKNACDYIRSKGMVPGLWFEMENVACKAKNFTRTELFLKKDGVPLTVDNRRFRDMENPENIAFLSEKVIGTLKDAGFGYIKIDYNETIGVGCDGEDGFGENLRRKVLATQSFFKKIAKEIPGIVIENCCSGGHRLEPSFLELASEASFSDAHETEAIPIIAANLHRVMKPQQSQIWAVLRKDATDERLHYLLCATCLGRMCLSGDIYDMSSHQWDVVEEGMAFYRAVSHIIKDGKTTLIHAPFESYNHPTREQLVIREFGDEALWVFHRFAGSHSLEEVLGENGFSLGDYEILQSYGSSACDFDAQAVWVRKDS